MKEILAGDNISNAFNILGINANQTYRSNLYQVWEIPDEDFNKLDKVSDEEWKDDWGWWRYSEGSNIENYPTHEFTVNGEYMLGYFDDDRYEGFLEDDEEDGEEDGEIDYWYFIYEKLTEYLCNEIGASTETNVCAVAMSLAKLNNISLGELFSKYEG